MSEPQWDCSDMPGDNGIECRGNADFGSDCGNCPRCRQTENDVLFRSAIDGEVIGTGKEQIELLLHDRNRLLLAIDYWSHCMSEGMRVTCPEKAGELADFLISCKVSPWYIPKVGQ